MARLSVNFAPRSAWTRPAGILLLIGLFGIAHALWYRDRLLVRRDVLHQKIETILHVAERDANRHRVTNAKKQGNDPSTMEMQRIVASMQRPWEPMLDALHAAARPPAQSAAPIDIVLTAIQPDTNTQKLIVGGQAADNAALLSFVQRLRADRAWRIVELMSQSMDAMPVAAQPNASSMPLMFQLAVEWQGG